MLTRKQYELLIFIDKKLNETGVSPSFDEMKDALDLKSKSGIHRLITGLEERGFIRRLPHRARALEVLRLPDNLDPSGPMPERLPRGQGPGAQPRFSPQVIKGEFKLPGTPAAPHANSVALPLYGRIAAGTPIEALRNETDFIDVPTSLLGKGDHYALEVDGDSMVEAGILDGDTVVIRKGEVAENGTIVVANIIDENEVTLKRIRRKGSAIALEPANRLYETRIFGPDQVKVQGYLVGLVRKY